MIKNVLFIETKNTCVHFFIYMSSMCVQLFTASSGFEVICTSVVSVIKSKMATISMETKRGGNKLF